MGSNLEEVVIALFWDTCTWERLNVVLGTSYAFKSILLVKLVYVEIMCFTLPLDQLRTCTYSFMDQ